MECHPILHRVMKELLLVTANLTLTMDKFETFVNFLHVSLNVT